MGWAVPGPAAPRPRCPTCSCSAVKEVRALLAGFGWLSCSEGTAPSSVIPLPAGDKSSEPPCPTAGSSCWSAGHRGWWHHSVGHPGHPLKGGTTALASQPGACCSGSRKSGASTARQELPWAAGLLHTRGRRSSNSPRDCCGIKKNAASGGSRRELGETAAGRGSRWCVRASTDVPLALTPGHHLATFPREWLGRDPVAARLTNIHHSCPSLPPVTPFSLVGVASISPFIYSEHFNGLFAPFPSPRLSQHPDLLFLPGPRAAAGAAPSPRPWGGHA